MGVLAELEGVLEELEVVVVVADVTHATFTTAIIAQETTNLEPVQPLIDHAASAKSSDTTRLQRFVVTRKTLLLPEIRPNPEVEERVSEGVLLNRVKEPK